MSKNYYDVLGVSKSAGQEEIKKAFRQLAHEHHPDKSGGNADKFKEINEAYQVLGNEDKRRQYDQFFTTGNAGGFSYSDFARGGNPFGGFASGGAGQEFHFDFGDLGDLGDLFGGMGGFFGGQSSKRRSRRGADLEIEITIDFEEAVFGVEKIIDLSKQVICQNCGGTGAEPGSKISDCRTCHGRGHITRSQQTILGAFATQAVCPDCHGEGKTIEKKCGQCRGAGIASGQEKIKVKIPAGISNSQSIKLSGQGEPSPKGAPGDLYLTVKVRASQHFKREKDDIFSQVDISINQAFMGDKIMVETVDGPVALKIPAGTQSHTQFRLRDKGLPHLQGRGRGDHLVTIIVKIPHSLSRQQKKLLEELGI